MNYKALKKDDLYHLLAARFDKTPSKLKDIPSPELLLNANKAVTRLAKAITNNEKIALVGDYDVDGVSSTSITTLFFREINYPLEVIIPNRFTDGYGVSASIIERLAPDTSVIFTVDNGIAAFEAAEICTSRNIDLIITDHHTPAKDLPDAFTIVDPKLHECEYPFKEICGAQVIWLLLGLLKKELNLKVDMKQYLPILALAIIADVMPLVGINRTLVQHGLKMMGTSSLPAFVLIREFLNKTKLSSEDIGFQIAPRLNAAGRLEDASIALEFLTAPTEDKAYSQFELLNKLNDARKATEADVSELALDQVSENDKVLVVSGEHWHEGVVGIVASRLVNAYEKPTIVLSIHEKEGKMIAKGSGRSLGDVNLYDLLATQRPLLDKFGGHMMAAGLSLDVENIESLKKGLNEEANKLPDSAFIPKEEIMGSLSGDDIDLELLDLIEQFEPYGEANPRPRFMVENAEVVSVQPLGKEKLHSKLSLRFAQHERKTHDLLAFRQQLSMPSSRSMSCSYTLNKNEFNGRVSVQLMLERIY